MERTPGVGRADGLKATANGHDAGPAAAAHGCWLRGRSLESAGKHWPGMKIGVFAEVVRSLWQLQAPSSASIISDKTASVYCHSEHLFSFASCVSHLPLLRLQSSSLSLVASRTLVPNTRHLRLLYEMSPLTSGKVG